MYMKERFWHFVLTRIVPRSHVCRDDIIKLEQRSIYGYSSGDWERAWFHRTTAPDNRRSIPVPMNKYEERALAAVDEFLDEKIQANLEWFSTLRE